MLYPDHLSFAVVSAPHLTWQVHPSSLSDRRQSRMTQLNSGCVWARSGGCCWLEAQQTLGIQSQKVT